MSSSSSQPPKFWKWLFFPDLLVGLTFSYTLFITPTLINFHTLLTDCSRQGTYEGCMAADSNEDTSCIWNATTSTCAFADQFDCSVFNNDSIKCATDPSSASYCYYRFLSSSSSSSSGPTTNNGNCLHVSGWSDVQTGLIAAFGVMGGIFAPFVLGQVAKQLGFPVTLGICGCLALISAIIFSIAVENGQNFTMYLLARVIASICAYAGSYLYPSILSANSHHNTTNTITNSGDEEKNDENQKEEESNEKKKKTSHTKKKYFIVSPEEKTTHTRIMGNSIGLIAFLQACYLYGVSPEGSEAQNSNVASASLIKLDTFRDFKTMLQIYNIVQFLIGIGYLVFAGLLKYYNDLEYDEEEEEKEAEEMKQEEKKETNEPSTPPPETQQQQQPIPIIDEEVTNFLLAPPCSAPPACCCSTKNSFLMWCGGILAPIVLQLGGQIGVISFTPTLLGDVVKNSLLAQLIGTAPMPLGSLFSLFVLGRYFSPLQIYICCGFACVLGCVFIGVGIYLPTTVDDGSNDDASAGLSLFGLVFFSFFFTAGPGTLVFSAMIEVYHSIDLPKIPSRKEFSRIVSQVAASPEQKEFDEQKEKGSKNNSRMMTPHPSKMNVMIEEEENNHESTNNNEPTTLADEKEESHSPLHQLHDRHNLLHLLHKNQAQLMALGVSVSGSFTACLQFSFRFAFPVFVKNVYPDDIRVGRAIAFFGFAVVSFLANVLLILTQYFRGRNVGAPKAVVKIVDGFLCN